MVSTSAERSNLILRGSTLRARAARTSLLPGALVLALLAIASPAGAQNVLFSGGDVRANPLLPESNGFKLGEGRLHPFIELDAHQVHNPGRFPADAFNGSPSVPSRYRNDFYFVVRPGVDYKLPSPKLEIGATAYVERQEYINAEDFSSWQGGLGGTLHYNKEGPFQLRVNQLLTRSAAPGNQTFVQRFNHWTENLSVGADFIPGGGALKLTAEMAVFLDEYDDSNSNQVDPVYLNNERYSPLVRAAWAFLPKTQVFVEGGASFANFRSVDDPNVQSLNADSWVYHGSAGLNGIITPKISALAKVGFTGINTDGSVAATDVTKNTVGAQAEATWNITTINKLRLGGARQIDPVSIFLFATTWKAYARYDHLIASRLNVSLGAEYANLHYGRNVSDLATGGTTDDGNDQRRDNLVQASIAFAYYVNDFITISIVDRVDYRTSNYQYPQFIGNDNEGNALTRVLPSEYITNDIFLRLGVRY